MKELVSKIQQIVLSASRADDFELWISFSDSYDARFAQNAISHHMSGQNLSVFYKAVIDQKVASSTVNQYDEETIKNLVYNTEELAKINQPDPEYAETLSKKAYPQVNNMIPETVALSPEKVIDIIKTSIEFSKEKGTLLSGIFSKSQETFFYLTKNGFEGTYETCSFDFSMTMKKEECETKISVSGKDFTKFDLQKELNRLFEQFSALSKPVQMEPETINVILRPQAVANLVMFLGWILDRRMADDGITPFKGQIGKAFFGEKFSISTLAEDDSMTIYPFTSDAVLKAIDWVKNGVINSLPMSRSYAKMIGDEAGQMLNMYIPGEDISEEDMMKMAGRGLIINNLWYIRPNDMRTADFTGMTRDGVLYFENGEVKHSVNNFRFNEKLHEITHRILALGESLICENTIKVPSFLIKDFNFVDKTNF